MVRNMKIFLCSGADYAVDDNLAGTLAFNPDESGLLSIGSSKTGGMWYDSSFFSVLANKSVFGEAFRQWFNNAQGIIVSAPQWWYGMTLIGDAALMRSVYMVEPCEGDFDDSGDVNGSDLNVFAADFGRTGCITDCKGAFDDDDDVDGSDLATFSEDTERADCP